MAEKKERKFLKDFGGEADDEFFQQFGGFIKGNNEKKKDPVKLQELEAFTQGWQAACEQGNKLPVMEEMNGLFYLFGYFIKYLYQEGIPEWNAEEIYYKGSVVKYDGFVYKAVYENVDGFSGLPEPSSSSAKPFWAELSFKNLVAERLTAGSAKITGTDPDTELSLDVTGNANINGKLTVVADGNITAGGDISANTANINELKLIKDDYSSHSEIIIKSNNIKLRSNSKISSNGSSSEFDSRGLTSGKIYASWEDVVTVANVADLVASNGLNSTTKELPLKKGAIVFAKVSGAYAGAFLARGHSGAYIPENINTRTPAKFAVQGTSGGYPCLALGTYVTVPDKESWIVGILT